MGHMSAHVLFVRCIGMTRNPKPQAPGEINAGVIEGVLYDAKGIDAIGKLPSKKELYAKIAGGISAVPAKLAGTVKEVPQKTSRAIKLAFAPDA